jgi:hypothetical protein
MVSSFQINSVVVLCTWCILEQKDVLLRLAHIFSTFEAPLSPSADDDN